MYRHRNLIGDMADIKPLLLYVMKTTDEIIRKNKNIIDARSVFIKQRRLVKQSFLVDNYEMKKIESELLNDYRLEKQGFYTEIIEDFE